MVRKLLGILGAGCMLLTAAPALSAPIQHIVNGDFETGDFTGWVNVGEAGGLGFSINDGSFDPPGPGAPTAPIAGSFDAVSSQTGPGVNLLLSQAFVVPDNIALATVSWDDRIENWAPIFQDPNQEFRVVIQDVLGTTVFEIFSTNPGDPITQPGPNHREFDISAALQGLAGEAIQLAFVQQDNLSFLHATIDNVSLTTRLVPEPGAATLFGLGALVVGWRTRGVLGHLEGIGSMGGVSGRPRSRSSVQ